MLFDREVQHLLYMSVLLGYKNINLFLQMTEKIADELVFVIRTKYEKQKLSIGTISYGPFISIMLS